MVSLPGHTRHRAQRWGQQPASCSGLPFTPLSFSVANRFCPASASHGHGHTSATCDYSRDSCTSLLFSLCTWGASFFSRLLSCSLSSTPARPHAMATPFLVDGSRPCLPPPLPDKAPPCVSQVPPTADGEGSRAWWVPGMISRPLVALGPSVGPSPPPPTIGNSCFWDSPVTGDSCPFQHK